MMKGSRKYWRSVVAVVGVVLGLMVLTTMAVTAGTPEPKVYGKTYGEWSAKWWQWIRSIPAQSNPLLSSGEVDCSIGQSGPVFFLAGTTGGAPVVRECTVPKGKELFFSLLNLMFYNDPADPPPPLTEVQKRELLDGLFSDIAPEPISFNFNIRACNLSSTVNGVSTLFSAVTTARTQSPAFRIRIIEDDVFGGTAGAVDKAAVSDGFWVMLRLPKGEHTLRFQGDLCDEDTNVPLDGFHQDVTYHLRVK